MRSFFISLCVLFASSATASASAREIYFGPEFTFSRWSLVLSGTHNDFWPRIATRMQDYCSRNGCSYEADSRTLTLATGIRMYIEPDQNVFEVQMDKITASQFLENESEIQRALFDNFKELGLVPKDLYGSGHINIDLESAFNGNVKLLKNFVVDYFNHPGISYGVMDHDASNALPFFFESLETKANFQKLIDDVDRGTLRTIREFISRMNWDVYEGTNKFRSISFKDNRLEMRAIRSQKTAHHFYLQTRMFEKRIRYLERLTLNGKSIAYQPEVGVNGWMEGLAQYYFYLKDIGVDWNEYEEILPSRYRMMPLIKNREWAFRPANFCNRLLQKITKKVENFSFDHL